MKEADTGQPYTITAVGKAGEREYEYLRLIIYTLCTLYTLDTTRPKQVVRNVIVLPILRMQLSRRQIDIQVS